MPKKVQQHAAACTKCGSGSSRVLRNWRDGAAAERLRRCLDCGKRFVTTEVAKQDSRTGIEIDDTGIDMLKKHLGIDELHRLIALKFNDAPKHVEQGEDNHGPRRTDG